MEQSKPQIAVDPNLATEQAQAQATLVSGLQTQAQMDTADLMTRYGTRLALAGSGLALAGSGLQPIGHASDPVAA